MGALGCSLVTPSAHHLDTMWQVPSARITHTLHVLAVRIGPCSVLSRIAIPQIAARAAQGPRVDFVLTLAHTNTFILRDSTPRRIPVHSRDYAHPVQIIIA